MPISKPIVGRRFQGSTGRARDITSRQGCTLAIPQAPIYVSGEWNGVLIAEVKLDLETEFEDVVVYKDGCGDMLELGLRIVDGHVRASKP